MATEPIRIQPMSGQWPTASFPEVVELAGRTFRRARWKQGYVGVVEQYREDVATDSAHLKVYEDGRWTIDHIDKFNPDKGREVRHFFSDHPAGKLMLTAGTVAGVAACAYVATTALSAYSGASSDG